MGRNTKGNKDRKIKHLIIAAVFSFLIYFAILLISGILGLGSAWEIWKANKQYALLFPSLMLYRALEYTVPAIVIKLVLKKSWRESFNYQFACYAIIKAVPFVLGLDYAFEMELFSSAESFIIIIGYVLSLVEKEKILIDDTIDILEDNK